MKHKPAYQLSGRGLSALLFTVIATTMTILVVSTLSMGRAVDKPLPVDVAVGKRPVPVPGGGGAMMTDVVILSNQSGDSIPNLDISINSQYFLYRDAPLAQGEELVLPQSIFSTKSSQRYDPERYPLTSITVTGRLPSGSRGVIEKAF